MSRSVKTLIGGILGAIIGGIIITIYSGDNSAVLSNTMPFIAGAVIAFFIINYITTQVKKAKEEE